VQSALVLFDLPTGVLKLLLRSSNRFCLLLKHFVEFLEPLWKRFGLAVFTANLFDTLLVGNPIRVKGWDLVLTHELLPGNVEGQAMGTLALGLSHCLVAFSIFCTEPPLFGQGRHLPCLELSNLLSEGLGLCFCLLGLGLDLLPGIIGFGTPLLALSEIGATFTGRLSRGRFAST